VVGAVRNVGQTLASTIRDIQRFCGETQVHSWLFVESDSTDNTLETLDALAGQIHGLRFQSLGQLSSAVPERIKRIAMARQSALDGIRGEIRPEDLVIVADCDGVTRSLARNDFLRSIQLLDKYSVITANSRGRYYDILALRAPGWVEDDYRAERSRLLSSGLSIASAHYQSVISKQIKLGGRQAYEVDSAFGGFAIYRGATYLLSNYQIRGEKECEHVHFNRILKSKGVRLCIDPALQVRAEKIHTILSHVLFRPVWSILMFLPRGLSDFIVKLAIVRTSR
jgi:glycosyltransferase involved in cell wall biosynthesis